MSPFTENPSKILRFVHKIVYSPCDLETSSFHGSSLKFLLYSRATVQMGYWRNQERATGTA